MRTSPVQPTTASFPVPASPRVRFRGESGAEESPEAGSSSLNLTMEDRVAIRVSLSASKKPDVKPEAKHPLHKTQTGKVTKPNSSPLVTNPFLKDPERWRQVSHLMLRRPDLSFEEMSHMFMRKLNPSELSELGHQTVAAITLVGLDSKSGTDAKAGQSSGKRPATAKPSLLRKEVKFAD